MRWHHYALAWIAACIATTILLLAMAYVLQGRGIASSRMAPRSSSPGVIYATFPPVLLVTATRLPSPTKAPTVKPQPTDTPLPTYSAQSTPGLYEFVPPIPVETPDVVVFKECADLAATPTPLPIKRICEVS